MSHAAGLEVLVLGAAGLVEALAETGLECLQVTRFQSDDGKVHAVDVVVRDEKAGASVGVKIDSRTGRAQFIAGDCRAGGVKGRALANRVLQRHALHHAIGELRRKGYTITSEKSDVDGTVRVVAQRWR